MTRYGACLGCGYCEHMIFDHIIIHTCGNPGLYYGRGVSLGESHNCTVSNSRVTDITDEAFTLFKSNNNK